MARHEARSDQSERLLTDSRTAERQAFGLRFVVKAFLLAEAAIVAEAISFGGAASAIAAFEVPQVI